MEKIQTTPIASQNPTHKWKYCIWAQNKQKKNNAKIDYNESTPLRPPPLIYLPHPSQSLLLCASLYFKCCRKFSEFAWCRQSVRACTRPTFVWCITYMWSKSQTLPAVYSSVLEHAAVRWTAIERNSTAHSTARAYTSRKSWKSKCRIEHQHRVLEAKVSQQRRADILFG